MRKWLPLIMVALAGMILFGAGWTDLYSETTIEPSVPPDTTSIDVTGDSIDTMGYNSIILTGEIGDVTGTADTLSSTLKIEFEVEECSGDGSWTDVPDAKLSNYVNGTNDGCFAVCNGIEDMSDTYYCQYLGSKRYVRVVINATGNFTLGARVASNVIRSNAKYKPVTH